MSANTNVRWAKLSMSQHNACVAALITETERLEKQVELLEHTIFETNITSKDDKEVAEAMHEEYEIEQALCKADEETFDGQAHFFKAIQWGRQCERKKK